MNIPVWKAFALLALLFAALVLGTIGRSWWHHTFIEGQTFATTGLLDTGELVVWAFELGFFVGVGLIIGGLFGSATPELMGLAVGLFCGGIRLFWTTHSFGPDVTFADYFWSYGVFVVPAGGAIIGAWLWRGRGKPVRESVR